MRDPLRLTSVTGMGESRFRVEVVDDDVLVLDVAERLVHLIPGRDVDRWLAGRAAPPGHLPEGALAAVRASLQGRRVARRRVLLSGGALAACGIVTSRLPFAAAASSDLTITRSEGDVELAAISGGVTSASYLDTSAIADGTVQVLLRATRGGDGGADQPGSGGAGAYLAATIAGIPTGGRLYFKVGTGGLADGSDAYPARLHGGAGGTAPAVSWSGTSPFTFLAVAGAGGGAGGGDDGGDFGQDGGGGAAAGRGATTSSAGAAGTLPGGAYVRNAQAGYGPGSTGTPGSRFVGGSVGGIGGIPDQSNGDRLFGGGGGAGLYQGGGGHGESSEPDPAPGGGGGGGSTYLRTTEAGGLPHVTTSRVAAAGGPLAAGADLTVYYTPV